MPQRVLRKSPRLSHARGIGGWLQHFGKVLQGVFSRIDETCQWHVSSAGCSTVAEYWLTPVPLLSAIHPRADARVILAVR